MNWTQMQQDYIKRTAKKAAAESTAAATLTSPTSLTDTNRSNTRYMPRKRATTGSVMDNAGGEVVGDRVIMYIHGNPSLEAPYTYDVVDTKLGGAFFFSSLETHRYQVQRHVRKAGARAFCPAYRLSPQYPFVRTFLTFPDGLCRHILAMWSPRLSRSLPLPHLTSSLSSSSTNTSNQHHPLR